MPQFDFKCLLKGELLQKVSSRYPDVEPESLELLTVLKQVGATLQSLGDQLLAEKGISEGRFYILVFLELEELQGHDDPHPSTIADNIGVTRATVTGLLDGLERDGLVERRHNTLDRRALTICLTAKGREVLDSFVPIQTREFRALFSPLDADEKRTLIRLLSKLEPTPGALQVDASAGAAGPGA